MSDAPTSSRLEELRTVLRDASFSYADLAELQQMALHNQIPAGDLELLEAAGVPEVVAHDAAALKAWGARERFLCTPPAEGVAELLAALEVGAAVYLSAGGDARFELPDTIREVFADIIQRLANGETVVVEA